ncbi:MAG: hypothetical protein M1492_13320 [Gammaproteobacteria bacterium]|nr:hypothetical protein [Gammaproteobacteria bacterium]
MLLQIESPRFVLPVAKRKQVQTIARKPAWLRWVMRSATCAQTERREEFGWLAGRNRHLPVIIEIRTARETPPLLALRGHEKARSMSGL